ncbi:MAG: hypothetical protein ABI645_14400 [Pseudomonadota bacterium]
MTLPVVRLSRGLFESSLFAEVERRLAAAEISLVPAIRELKGCLHFWAAIDERSNSMVNLSVWATVEDAMQMDTLPSMLALGKEFAAIGVKFERPIINYKVLWAIEPGA